MNSVKGLGLAFVAALALPVCAQAKPFMVVGNDAKVTWDDAGQVVLSAPGKDTVSIIDLADPDHPKIVTSLPLENSVIGPPTNIAITPSGALALVANSVDNVTDNGALKQVPIDQLHIIDLTANPPKLLTTLQVGKQPSGLDINAAGDMAMIANRADKSVTVLSIKGTEVKVTDTIAFPDSVAHVAFTPDGRHALAVRNVANLVSVIDIGADGKAAYNKLDLPTGTTPYNLVVTPNGKLALSLDQGNNGGGCDGNVDGVSVMDLKAAPPHVIDRVVVGDCPEGMAISPKGDLAIAVLIGGTNSAKNAWFRHKTGSLALLAIHGDKVTKIKEVPAGNLPEAIAFSPDGGTLYVGNYFDDDIAIYKVKGTEVTDTGRRLKLPGHPAAGRAGP
jgi:DNA-binding beta-propeller fold protein YncE